MKLSADLRLAPVSSGTPTIKRLISQVRSLSPLTTALGGVVIFGLVLRIARLFTPKLWTDEAFSAAISKEPLIQIISLTLRHDSHPPLYYIQLHFWQLISDSDTWLIINSVVLSFFSTISVLLVLKFLYGRREALIGLAVFSVLPLEVIFSETLRMYCLENLLVIWMFYVAECFIRDKESDHRNLVIFVMLGSLINMLHGFGAMVTFFIVIYTFVRALEERIPRRQFLKIFLASLTVGITTLYSLIVGSMRQTIGLESSNLSAISSEITISLLGFNIPCPSIMGVIFVVPFIVLCLFEKRSRSIVWWLFIAPTILMILISIFIKPVYTFRGTGLFMPFEAIGFAVFAGSRVGRVEVSNETRGLPVFAMVSLVGFLSVLSVASFYNAMTYRKGGFEQVSNFWATRSKPGDVIYVNSFLSDYLGFVRYLPGAARPAVHEVQAPPPAHWQKIFSRIGPTWVQRLHLLPDANSLPYRARTVFPWFDGAIAGQRARFWVLQPNGAGCGLPDYHVTMQDKDGTYSVLLCERIVSAGARVAPFPAPFARSAPELGARP